MFIKGRGQTAPAHIVGQYLLFLRGSQTALRLDLLQGTDGRYIILIFGFLAASAEVIIGDMEIVLLRAEMQFFKYNIKGSGVYPPHHFRRILCGRRDDSAAVNLHPLRLRGEFRLPCRFLRVCQQFLRLPLQTDEVIKIQRRQFVVDHFPQGLVPAFLHKLAVQCLRDAEINQIDRDLDFVLFVLRGGIGDANVRQIGKINIVLPILRLAELPHQLFGFFQFVGFGVVVVFRGFRHIGGIRQLFHMGSLLKFPPLRFLHILPDKRHRFLPENRIAVFLRHLHVKQADLAVGVVDAVHLHAPSVNGQLFAQGDIFGNIPFLDDLIGSAVRVGLGQQDAVPMLQQLFKNGLPCAAVAGDGGDTQTGNIQCGRLCPQRRGSFLGIFAVEHHKLAYLNANELIRVLGFQIEIFFYVRGEITFNRD